MINLIRSRSRGLRVGADPWGAPTIEWSLPSPVPEYNFDRIPTITSRYPMWDLKSPALTADVPHTVAGEKRTNVEVGGKHAGQFGAPKGTPPSGVYLDDGLQHRGLAGEPDFPTAAQLGIPMPTPTIKPLLASLALSMGFVGLMYRNVEGMGSNATHTVSMSIMIVSGALFAFALIAWLTTPLEPEHH
jgi:cytochrome c oxidase subunit I